MLWPNGHDTWLIEADHADVIGHFENGSFLDGAGRKRERGHATFQRPAMAATTTQTSQSRRPLQSHSGPTTLGRS